MNKPEQSPFRNSFFDPEDISLFDTVNTFDTSISSLKKFSSGNNNSFNSELISFQPIKDRKIRDVYKLNSILYQVDVAPTTVYLAEHKEKGTIVAVKHIDKSKLSTFELKDMICNELALTAKLSNIIREIVQVYEYYEDDDSYSLVMEYCDRPNFFEEMLENVSHVK